MYHRMKNCPVFPPSHLLFSFNIHFCFSHVCVFSCPGGKSGSLAAQCWTACCWLYLSAVLLLLSHLTVGLSGSAALQTAALCLWEQHTAATVNSDNKQVEYEENTQPAGGLLQFFMSQKQLHLHHIYLLKSLFI